MSYLELPKNSGTPKNLLEAIENGLDNHFGTDTLLMRRHIKDFIAQRFQVAKCKAFKTPLNEADLQQLFEEIVK